MILTDLSVPEINVKEVLRYAGVPVTSSPDSELEALTGEVLNEVKGVFDYRVSYIEVGISRDGGLILGNIRINSRDLEKCLCGCDSAVIFAATVGSGIDRLIGKYSRLSPSRAALLQACGAERIEALCDAFCQRLREERGMSTRPRFSPGYGDLSLDIQRDIFSLLDCERRLCLTLNGSLLMSPTKSVTAIVGLYK